MNQTERRVILDVIRRLRGEGGSPEVAAAFAGPARIYLESWVIPALQLLVKDGRTRRDLADAWGAVYLTDPQLRRDAERPSGGRPLHSGDRVRVYQKPMTAEDFEEEATIVSVGSWCFEHEGHHFLRCRVQFDNDGVFGRVVSARDRVEVPRE